MARGFTDTRRGGLLGSDAQMSTMLRLISYVKASPLTILDLGCGDGILLDTVAAAFSIGQAVALDGSVIMLEKARERFSASGNVSDVTLIEADFNDPSWLDKLPVQEFDVVVSGFAIHHSEDERKQSLYREIFGLLNPGGLFVNIEHVASAGPLGEVLFERAYSETVAAFRNSRGEATTPEIVYQELNVREDKQANRLVPVDTQLQWLRNIGFKDVDCFWKHYELAVLGGYKP